MKAYPEDLRSKIVEAAERGMSTSGAACTFGVGISSVKRHAPDYESGTRADHRGGGDPGTPTPALFTVVPRRGVFGTSGVKFLEVRLLAFSRFF